MITLEWWAASPDVEAAERAYREGEAWRRWAIECCVERNRGHLWKIDLEPLDCDNGVDLSCTDCPAGLYDLLVDGEVYGEVQGIPIDGGRHRSLLPLTAPVTVDIRVEHYPSTPAHGEEWDVWIEVAG